MLASIREFAPFVTAVVVAGVAVASQILSYVQGRFVNWLFLFDSSKVDPDGAWALELRGANNCSREKPARPAPPLWWVREALALAGRLFLRFS